jgi:hypothetical protein
VGQAVTVAFTVTSGAGTPTGMVTVSSGPHACSAPAPTGSCTITFSSTGAETITATYGGDDNFAGSSGTEAHQVKATTATSLTTSSNPSAFGQALTLTATVTSGSGTPTGTVTFKDGTAILGTRTLDGAGVATFTTSSLAAGSHSLTATYAGDATRAASTSAPVSQTVKAPSSPPASAPSTTTTTQPPTTTTTPPTGEAGPLASGYWLVANDGGIFNFGDAPFLGSTGHLGLKQPIVAMARTPTGKGYWLVAADGGIFAFGDAQFFGSTGAIRLNQPVVGMAATATGKGYWLVARDGGIFAFGDAVFHGSTGAIRLNQPIVGMAANPFTGGYWLVAADGGIFAFNTPFYGSGVGRIEPGKAVAVVPTVNGDGYAIVSSSGIGYPYGRAIVARTDLDWPEPLVGVVRAS